MAGTKWLPIETAPKDAADVLLYNGSDTEIGNRGTNDKFFVNNEIMCPAPTHWMALPRPPNTFKEQSLCENTHQIK